MRYPTRLLTDDEDVVHEFRPHWRVLLVPVAWAMLLAAVGGFAVAVLDGRHRGWVLLAGVLLWLAVAGRRVLAWWYTGYVLTTERIVVRHGMIARRGSEIPLESITNVLFRQRAVERLLGYGDVLVESAGREGRSRLTDIPRPETFQSEIYRARELRALRLRGGPTGRARDVVAQLEALADLRERGHLSDEEFADHKRALLAGLPGVDAQDVDALVDEGDLDPGR